MSPEQEQLAAGIAALEAQRAWLGDAVVDASLAALRARLAALAEAAPPAAGQVLRQVSILFLDVVGSTALSQHLDPEDIHAVMDGALASCSAVVQAHGGKVLQYAGDNLLAAFGADGAREDDAERAVHCGLALLAEGRRLGGEVQRAHGRSGFDVRVGIHTGGVLLGGGVDAEGSIRGIAVNIAARMEQAAPAGGLRVSHDTWALVRGLFEGLPQEPLAVKGVDAPVRSVLVQRARPAGQRVGSRGIEGVQTRMVGRGAELAALREAAQRVFGERRLGAVAVVADAGIGKSRLLDEFEQWVVAHCADAHVFRAGARAQTQGQPYGLLRDMLAAWLRIADGDSLEAARQKVEQGMVPLFTAGDGADAAFAHAHLLGHLIGIDFADSPHVRGIQDDGRQIRQRGFHAAAQLLRRLAARDGAPIVLLLDDLHWADDGSLDFLVHLAAAHAELPLLLLALARPGLFERRPGWPGIDGAQRIALGPLGQADSRALADELLKKLGAEVPPALRQLVTRGAEGNPFYMEELIKMLVDEGAIVAGDERWTVVPGKLQATRVPRTLTGVLQARLDSLKPPEKLALQQASVIGFVFWDQALAAIDPAAPGALPGVTRRELVLRRPQASLDGVAEYAFHHQLLHQVTYDTVLKRLRRDYHARAAAWLAGLTGARANDFLGVAADHFEKAGEVRRACEFFARAAEHALARYAHEAVAAHVERALALIGDAADPALLRLRWRLLGTRERALDLQGLRAAHEANIDEMRALAEALDDDHLRADAAKRLSYLAMRKSDTRTQISAAREAIAFAERSGSVELKLRAQNLLATGLCDQGDVATGRALALEGLAATRAHGLRRVEGSFLNTLALIAVQLDDLAGHLEMGRQQWLLFKDLGDLSAEAVTQLHLGISLLGAGALMRSRPHLEEGLRLARAAGDRVMEPYAQTYLSLIARRQGANELAMALAEAALATSLEVRNVETQITALFQIAEIELARRRLDAAGSAFERAFVIAVEHDEPLRFDAAAGLARVALAREDGVGALRVLAEVLAHIAGGGTLDRTESRQRIRITCVHVLAAVGDARAAQILTTAHADLQRQAERLDDPELRHHFLNDLPEHREIAAAWAAQTSPQTKKAARCNSI